MSTQNVTEQAQQGFQKTIVHLKQELSRLQIGRASSALVESIDIEAYGTVQQLKALAGISIPDARTIQIQPWDSSILAAIEKGIRNSDLGLNPAIDGTIIRISIPPLTEERRQSLVKLVHAVCEEAKIAVRNIRHDAHGAFKEMERNKEIGEDDLRHSEKTLQEKVDHVNKEIEEIGKVKEQDIMRI